MTVDPADFTDQRVLILGKGNSAFETADNLIEKAAVIHVAGPDGVRLAWKTHYVGHLRAVNNNFLDTYQLKSQNAILDGEVLSIAPQPGGGFLVRFSFVRADEVVKELYYDRILCCTGFRLDTAPFADECAPDAGHQGPLRRADLGVRVGQRAGPVLRRHADAAARFQEGDHRLHPRLPLHRQGPEPHPGPARRTACPGRTGRSPRRRRRWPTR